MDHSDVREVLEDAAIEPGGLDRLMAGDTAAASMVAGHLAGCADCADELERLRRSVGVIGPALRAVPPPELRDRTLAYVAAVGRPRGTPAAAQPEAEPAGVAAATKPWDLMPHVPEGEAAAVAARRRTPIRLGWLAGLAAALIVAVSGTALLVDRGHDATNRIQTAEIEALGDVVRWTLRIDGQPDGQRVQLADATGTGSTGTLVYSPSSTELVVVADGLTPAAAGQEYRCWVEVGGVRTGIGKMFFGGDLAYWVGDVPAVASLGPNVRFGVNLVDLAHPDTPGEPALVSAG